MKPRVFLNAGFGVPIGRPTLDMLVDLGFSGVRQGIDTSDLVQINELVSEFRPAYGLEPLFVVDGGCTQPISVVIARALATVRACAQNGVREYSIEVGNEPDLSAKYKRDPVGFGQLVQIVQSALPNGVRLVSGGIGSCSEDALEWLCLAALYMPLDCIVGFHTYRPGNPSKPLRGYSTRVEEFRALRAAAGGRELWHTEIGWTTARTSEWPSWLPCGKPLTNEQVLSYLVSEAQFLAAQDIPVMSVYQWSDGPDPRNPLDRFGICALDGTLKPQARLPKEM